MKMIDRLPGPAAVVRHEPEARRKARLLGEDRRDPLEPAQQGDVGVRRVREARHVLLRDDQHVRRRLRVDVLDDDGIVVLVDHLSGDGSRYDLAEEAVGLQITVIIPLYQGSGKGPRTQAPPGTSGDICRRIFAILGG